MSESPMPDSLGVLEAERAKLLQQFLSLSDLRPGSITAILRPVVVWHSAFKFMRVNS